MPEFLRQLFSSGDFMPHGYCYLWDPGLVWLHVISDSLITAAYIAIPLILLKFIRKRRDIPFNWMFVCFGVFIVACGMTHAMEVWNLWHADYWFSGVIKAITAAASVGTAVLLIHLIPQVEELPSLKTMQSAIDELRQQAELLDLAHDAIFVADLQRHILYWNRGAQTLYGWNAEEAQGKIGHELLQTQFPKPLAEIEERVYETGSWEGEVIQKTRDGSEVAVASRWSLRRGRDGQPTSILKINRDVTKRRYAERRFQNLLEAAPDAMVIMDGEGRITISNAQTVRIFGYAPEELIGQRIEVLMPERFRSRHAGHRTGYFENPRARGMGAGLELAGLRKDGSEFPVEISLSPLKTEEGTVVIAAIRDITERKEIEQAIEVHQDKLARTNAELEATNAELESFSYSVSHDLRAPLRHIHGFARILSEEYESRLDEGGKHYLKRVLEGAEHMGNLIDDLLNLSRVGRRDLVRQPADLNEIVRGVVAELSGRDTSQKIEWKIEPLPKVSCDAGLIGVVFTNLLGNAAKFTRPRERRVIEVGCRNGAGARVFYVRDNGVGFDPKYADKLFGVFQRLHRQEDFEGTGVGLATVQRIVQKHGGRIWAESQPEKGATFYFTLEKTEKNGLEAETRKEELYESRR